ncbi:MFS transporter [Microbacterium halophytorum]|uniref:MFS transporter n=1 Tax=Microbacterium halophytorum TaxID=2067568 RepID=UPI000CFBA94F|nr:MFS transporter [Microbacterium halophytorum]
MVDDAEPPVTRSIVLNDAQRWRAFWVCVSVAAFTILDISKVNVALPTIEGSLGGGSTELQLVVSGYILSFGLGLVPFGRIGDQRSRRTLMLVGLCGFALASLLCAVAPTIWWLVIARFLQGVAAGIQVPQVMGTIQLLFTGRERGVAFGLFGATVGLATAFGPTLGGALIAIGGAEDGWRWIFWMNVPLALLVALGVLLLLPQVRRPANGRLELDPVGLLLFAVAVVCLMTPFLLTTGSPEDSPARWWLLVPFLLFCAAFIAWERRYAARGLPPLVPLRLFRVVSWRNGNAIQLLYFAGLPTVFLLTAVFLQTGLGLEAVYAGMVTIGFAVLSAFTSWLSGRLVHRFGRALVIVGLMIVLGAIVGLVLVAYFAPDEAAPWLMAAILAVGGLGGGIVISPNQTLTLAEIPPVEGGLAGSVGQLGQRIGNAVGTSIGLSLFYATIYSESGGDGAHADSAVFHDAYGAGLLAAAVCVAGALAVAFMDMGERRRAARAGEGAL